jgi:hypothetical protein
MPSGVDSGGQTPSPALIKWLRRSPVAVTYDANGGSLPVGTPSVVQSGGPYGPLPTPVREGSFFKGWWSASSGGREITADSIVASNEIQTLYARWEEDPVYANQKSTEAAKQTATAELNALKTNAAVYYPEQLAQIAAIADQYLSQIAGAQSPNEVTDLLAKAKEEIAAVKTKQQIDIEKEKSAASFASMPITVADKEWTGKAINSGLSITATVGGKAAPLKAGTDYTLKFAKTYKSIGKAQVTVTGAGKYTGSKTLTFKIVPKRGALSKLTAGGKRVKVKWAKAAAAQKVTGYELSYKLITAKAWKTPVKVKGAKATAKTVKKLKKGKKYQFRIRAYKTVGGVKYNAPWSAVKTSGKVREK